MVAFPAEEAMSSPSALGILPGRAAPGRRGCEERESVVRMRGLLGPPSQGDHMCQCMRHRGWGATVRRARALSLLRPGESPGQGPVSVPKFRNH